MRPTRVLAALLVLASLFAVSSPVLAASNGYEPYSTLLKQMDAKKGSPDSVIGATVDKLHHHVRVTLENGSRPLVSYPPGDDKFLVDTLLHHHIHVIYAKKPAVHHVLRYVAGGVVIVLLLIGGGVWYYTRGRSGTDAPETDSPAPSAS
jgi:hypothetical protein